jgi:hypothetical protein
MAGIVKISGHYATMIADRPTIINQLNPSLIRLLTFLLEYNDVYNKELQNKSQKQNTTVKSGAIYEISKQVDGKVIIETTEIPRLKFKPSEFFEYTGQSPSKYNYNKLQQGLKLLSDTSITYKSDNLNIDNKKVSFKEITCSLLYSLTIEKKTKPYTKHGKVEKDRTQDITYDVMFHPLLFYKIKEYYVYMKSNYTQEIGHLVQLMQQNETVLPLFFQHKVFEKNLFKCIYNESFFVLFFKILKYNNNVFYFFPLPDLLEKPKNKTITQSNLNRFYKKQFYQLIYTLTAFVYTERIKGFYLYTKKDTQEYYLPFFIGSMDINEYFTWVQEKSDFCFDENTLNTFYIGIIYFKDLHKDLHNDFHNDFHNEYTHYMHKHALAKQKKDRFFKYPETIKPNPNVLIENYILSFKDAQQLDYFYSGIQNLDLQYQI